MAKVFYIKIKEINYKIIHLVINPYMHGGMGESNHPYMRWLN